jgi:hypothetical protein
MSIISKSNESRKVWKKPEIREVSPAQKTAGGAGDLNDQDDIWYTLS